MKKLIANANLAFWIPMFIIATLFGLASGGLWGMVGMAVTVAVIWAAYVIEVCMRKGQ